MTQWQETEVQGRRAILRVRWGAMAHQRAVLHPNEVLRVGQGTDASFVVRSDAQLRPVHFELSWDGSRGWLSNLSTPDETLLNGQRVEQAEVFNGSWIRAGRTDFSVYIERTTPPPETQKPDSPKMAEHKTDAWLAIQEKREHLFAVVDAARDERILQLLRESVAEYRSLYEGPRGEALEEVAPYLVSLSQKCSLEQALIQEGWGRNWGVYLTCHHPLEVVRRHLRKFLMVEMEEELKRLYFRFYDPRVLGQFLQTCNTAQHKEFFGPIKRFIMEAPEGGPCIFTDTAQSSPSQWQESGKD